LIYQNSTFCFANIASIHSKHGPVFVRNEDQQHSDKQRKTKVVSEIVPTFSLDRIDIRHEGLTWSIGNKLLLSTALTPWLLPAADAARSRTVQ
jgi:hypothetical protein